MELKILKKEDKSMFLEIPDELLQQMTSMISPSADADLQEVQGKVAGLEEKLATAEKKTMDDFTPAEKATFVIAWARELSPEQKAQFAEGVGFTAKEPAAETAEAEEKAETAVEVNPPVIVGKTELPGYKFNESTGLSIREA